ncbi:hypothetical protein ACFVIM_20205 [Streptomyces sp. NPDC057638]|uniref:hypothetical protein n=1 Tax=Streptomyces sp. NPDC057638 TaxID=3346190 RepID=UPI00369F91E2
MPTWITPRRLGATAILYAVFVSGWYLGQPLGDVGCEDSEIAMEPDPPPTIGEPGDVSVDLSRAVATVEGVLTQDFVATTSLVPCEPSPHHPRLVAWLTGDWR